MGHKQLYFWESKSESLSFNPSNICKVKCKGPFAFFPSHPTERRNTWRFFLEKKKEKHVFEKKQNIQIYVCIYIYIHGRMSTKKSTNATQKSSQKKLDKKKHSLQQVKNGDLPSHSPRSVQVLHQGTASAAGKIVWQFYGMMILEYHNSQLIIFDLYRIYIYQFIIYIYQILHQ